MFDTSKINFNNFSYYKSLSSTSDIALQQSKIGAEEYSLVFAEEQTKGRGRFQRVWQTYPYKSLAFSFIVEDFAEQLPLVLCCSMHRILKDKYKAKVAIKWPNDIYYNNKKLSGILVESFPLENNKRVYIIGIGLNVFSNKTDLEEVGFLDQTTNVKLAREDLLNDIFAQIKQDISSLNQDGFLEFKDYFMQNCIYLNEKIQVKMYNKEETGVFVGINSQGYLILKQKEVILNIPAGQIVQQK